MSVPFSDLASEALGSEHLTTAGSPNSQPQDSDCVTSTGVADLVAAAQLSSSAAVMEHCQAWQEHVRDSIVERTTNEAACKGNTPTGASTSGSLIGMVHRRRTRADASSSKDNCTPEARTQSVDYEREYRAWLGCQVRRLLLNIQSLAKDHAS